MNKRTSTVGIEMDKNKKPILSFTSHKARLPLIDDIFRNHVEIAEELGMDVCFSCQDDSIPYLTDYQKKLIESGKVELLHVPKDHGSNTKWTLCRKEHPEAVMVVVDDDWEYDVEGIRSLLDTHERYPNAIICRAFRTIPWIGRNMPLYEVRPKYSYPKTATAHIMINRRKDNVSTEEYMLKRGKVYPEHFLGVLYPTYFPDVDPNEIPSECLKDDDIYVGSRIAAENRDIVFAGRKRLSECKEKSLPGALWNESVNVNGRGTYNALKTLNKDFQKQDDTNSLGSVYLLTCYKYPNRRVSVKQELDRVGIDYIEQFDDGSFMPEVDGKHKWLNRCHLAKYQALSRFAETSAYRVTIIEDDIRFIKDISELSKVLDTMPEDIGACRLSWAPSPYLKRDMEENYPDRYKEINKALSEPGGFYSKCPYASTDGCTVISRDVALEFLLRLKELVLSGRRPLKENSDDLLCRVCFDLKRPMYVYKPLVCIQTNGNDCEKGKSDVTKFLKGNMYPSVDISRPLDNYSGGQNKNSVAISFPSDGFFYQWPIIRDGISVRILPRSN